MMISQFVYPTLFSCATLGAILIASLIPMFNNIWYTLNNLSCSTIIYIHCVLSTSTTAAICYIMVQKHNEELDALMKEQISIEIIDTSDLQSKSLNESLKKEEIEEDVREALDRIADLGLMNDLQCGLNKFIEHILY